MRVKRMECILTQTHLIASTYQFINLQGSSGIFRLQRGEGSLEGVSLRLAPCILKRMHKEIQSLLFHICWCKMILHVFSTNNNFIIFIIYFINRHYFIMFTTQVTASGSYLLAVTLLTRKVICPSRNKMTFL